MASISPLLSSAQLNSFVGNNSRSIIHFNARSLRKHFDEFHNLVSSFTSPFSIIGITETWLSEDDRNLFCFPSYTPYYCHRLSSNHGGAAIYVLSNIPCKRRFDLELKAVHCESVWLEFEHSFLNRDNKNFILGCVYRSPSSPVSELCTNLQHSLNAISLENKNAIIMGDININLLDDLSPNTINYLGTVNSYGYECLINLPTRPTSNRNGSLIDHALSNLMTSPDAAILEIEITDHYPIVLRFNHVEKPHSPSFTRHIFNQEKFIEAVANTDWSEVYLLNDAQEAFTLFSSILLTHVQSCTDKQRCKK